MPPPAIRPNSATPVKLVNPAAKNDTAVVQAPIRMAGPTPDIVSSKARFGSRVLLRTSRYRAT